MNKVYIVGRDNGAQLIKPFEIGEDTEIVQKSLTEALNGNIGIIAYIRGDCGCIRVEGV
jgi:hypothetical protein